MKLEGSLDAFSLPDIFQLLSFTKKSGGLRLSHGPAVGVVYFTEGFVTGASSDGSRQALVRRLIGSGVLDDTTISGAVDAAISGSGVGPWLIESGAIDAELVRQAATEQTVDAVFDLLRWSAGDFAFQMDDVNPDDVGVRLAGDAVVAEATQRQAIWSDVSSVIPGPDTLLVMPVVVAGDPIVSRDEWALLALVDGRRRIGDLVELTGCGQYAVVTALAGLVSRGLVQVADQDDHVSTVVRRHGLLAPLEGRLAASLGTDEQHSTSDAEVEGSDPVVQDERPDEQPVIAPEEQPTDAAVDETTPSEDGADEPSEDGTETVDVPPVDIAMSAADVAVELPPDPAASAEDVADEVATDDARSQPAALLGRAHVPGDVVPPRPEPFIPTRRPEHPEPAPPARLAGVPSLQRQAVAATAVATEPEAAGLIERDPSVNRSLLLRLIAGVRGL